MSGEKRCQVSGSRAVSRKACQDSEMTSASQIERKWHHQKRAERKKCQGEKDVQNNRQQHERLSSEMKQAGSRENGSVRQGCRQNRKVKKKEPQELAQSTARTARRPGLPRLYLCICDVDCLDHPLHFRFLLQRLQFLSY